MDVNKMKVSELRKELRSRGLSAAGTKVELVERIQSVMNKTAEEIAEAESMGDLEEDLLNEVDDDDEHIEENDSVLNDLDATLATPTKPPFLKSTPKRRSVEAPQNGAASKRIVLTPPEPADKRETKTDETTVKKTIKLSDISAKERLDMRAKKFGLQSIDAKKEARAERFGETQTACQMRNVQTVASSPPASADVLQQRAKRFGVTVSQSLATLEQQERFEKRKQRFGKTVSANGVTAASKAKG